MFGIIYIKMVKISSTRNFQYKIVKSIVLSILIPAVIILFSAWIFFGDSWEKLNAKPSMSKTTKDAKDVKDAKDEDSCKRLTKDTCDVDTCVWDSDQNMCFTNK